MEQRAHAIVSALLTALCLVAAGAQGADKSSGDDHPLHGHLAKMLTGDNSQWRTPNPEYREGSREPREFALRMRLEPDKRHATGELTGRFADGREDLYWSLLAFYNPITERVIMQQIGWDGTLLRGEVAVQPGERQDIDMTVYAVSGAMQRTRHRIHFVGDDVHTADAYEYGGSGEWQLQRSWRWQRHSTPDWRRDQASWSGRSGPADSNIAPHVAHLLSGSGQWRAPNPEYPINGDQPEQFGMHYRWGPHRQHVVAEIVSVYADGRQEKSWSLFITHNPVEETTVLEQTGRAGLYFRGEMHTDASGKHIENGLIYFPDGRIKSVRDENVMIDPHTRAATVYERDADGGWQAVRSWTWKRL